MYNLAEVTNHAISALHHLTQQFLGIFLMLKDHHTSPAAITSNIRRTAKELQNTQNYIRGILQY
jgi:hypothetical protein